MEYPIRVAHVIGKWVGGGVESVVLNYYRHIDRNVIQFDFICDSDSTNIPYDEIKSLGGKVILVPPYQKIFSYHKELKRVLEEGNYKIVHSHINTLSVFSLFAAKRAGVPVRIAHSHSTSNKKEWKRNIVKNILRPFSKVFATNYMCCSEHAGRWLFGDKAYDKGDVYILNNAIELDKFKYDEKIRKLKRKELGVKDSTIVVGHVGRMMETKNQSFLLDIFKLISREVDSVLVFVGQGPDRLMLKRKAKSLKLEKKVLFLGQVNDVNEWYQAFDIFVLPSLYEGFGMVLLEAQVSNLPCVVSSGISPELKFIKNYSILKLSDSLEKWKEQILFFSNIKNRKNNSPFFKGLGFDIFLQANVLQKEYIKILKEDINGKN